MKLFDFYLNVRFDVECTSLECGIKKPVEQERITKGEKKEYITLGFLNRPKIETVL